MHANWQPVNIEKCSLIKSVTIFKLQFELLVRRLLHALVTVSNTLGYLLLSCNVLNYFTVDYKL